jgi:hypothetical protein
MGVILLWVRAAKKLALLAARHDSRKFQQKQNGYPAGKAGRIPGVCDCVHSFGGKFPGFGGNVSDDWETILIALDR